MGVGMGALAADVSMTDWWVIYLGAGGVGFTVGYLFRGVIEAWAQQREWIDAEEKAWEWRRALAETMGETNEGP